uniref:Transmembrane protein n=1 Tax=Bursaphelenchus xylophilus TaxID=6326 RepID=A0A1I7SLZ7_BURXY
MERKEVKDRTLVALMAILALLSVAAVLGLANYLYDGWVCAEKSILFNNQNWQIIHVDRPPCCLILPLCENCTLRRKGTVTSVMTSSIDIFELIGEEGFSFCDQISVGMSDLASNSVGMTRTKKSKNFVVCNEKRIVTSINTPTETLETYCSE